MGILDQFSKNKTTLKLSNEEAYWNVLFSMSASDGEMSKDERILIFQIAEKRDFLNPEILTDALKNFYGLCKVLGSFQEVIKVSLSNLDNSFYEKLYVDLYLMIFADGKTEDNEVSLMIDIKKQMNLSDIFLNDFEKNPLKYCKSSIIYN